MRILDYKPKSKYFLIIDKEIYGIIAVVPTKDRLNISEIMLSIQMGSVKSRLAQLRRGEFYGYED